MDAAAHPEAGPLVSLEQAVALAKHHSWVRVGFTIGVIAYAMTTVWAQRELDFGNGLWLLLFGIGVAVIGWSGQRWHRSAKATLVSATVVDPHGRVLGRADEIARREIERRAVNIWRVGHKSATARQVVVDDAPIPTHRPRERRGTPRRRR